VPTPSGAPSPLASEAPYVPRRPHDTVLYGIVREPLATFLADAARAYAAPLPSYVVAAFEGYLACGDLARGLLRCPCDGCGHDVLVAFSCKSRGLCPSCGVRRMGNEAATLVDRVLPNAPLRQWVLSLPFELRGLAATKPDVLGAMDHELCLIFFDVGPHIFRGRWRPEEEPRASGGSRDFRGECRGRPL
jgi:hypothetical protein